MPISDRLLSFPSVWLSVLTAERVNVLFLNFIYMGV